MKFKSNLTLPAGFVRLNLHQIETLLVGLVAKVNPCQAAGVDDGRVLGQGLVPVDMAQGDVVKGRAGHIAQKQHMLLPDGHLLFRANLGASDPYVGGEDGG